MNKKRMYESSRHGVSHHLVYISASQSRIFFATRRMAVSAAICSGRREKPKASMKPEAARMQSLMNHRRRGGGILHINSIASKAMHRSALWYIIINQ